MRLFWWPRRDRAAAQQQRAWVAAWSEAVRTRDDVALGTLEVQAGQRRNAGADVEIEEEMLEGARRAIALARAIDASGLPTLTTSHRVVGTDACHFTAPVSLVEDPAQPSGRLLLTSSRAIFVGGPKLIQAPWHAIRQAQQHERDLLLVRSPDDALRFRCNTFGDALAGAVIAERLQRTRRV